MKLYLNEKWLKNQYVTLGKTAKQIAIEQGVTEMTIYRKLQDAKLIRNSRANKPKIVKK